MLTLLAAFEDAGSEAAHISPWWYGGFTLVVFLLLMGVTLVMGKGRPHS
ncbi:hypothetical protein [Kribbella sp. NPDC055071]